MSNPTIIDLAEGHLQINLHGAVVYLKTWTGDEGDEFTRILIMVNGMEGKPSVQVKEGTEATLTDGVDVSILIPAEQPPEED